MHFYLPDVCITSFVDDTALTVFSQSVDDLLAEANTALKTLEVFTSLSLLCMNVKKRFSTTFYKVGDSIDVSGEVLFCEKSDVQVKSLRYFGFCGIFRGSIIATLFLQNCTWSRYSQKTEAYSAGTYSFHYIFCSNLPVHMIWTCSVDQELLC